jgi:hypothetical protein
MIYERSIIAFSWRAGVILLLYANIKSSDDSAAGVVFPSLSSPKYPSKPLLREKRLIKINIKVQK